MSNLKKISIDGIEVEVDGAMTIIQAAEVAGVEIPRFCYHERLTIAGNFRMCLVEVVGGPPKTAASCCMHGGDRRHGPKRERTQRVQEMQRVILVSTSGPRFRSSDARFGSR